MKKSILKYALPGLCCAVLIPAAAGAVTLPEKEATVIVGEKYTPSWYAEPEEELTWSTSDPKLATVKEGTITGVRSGTAEITVQSSDGTEETMTVQIMDRVSSLSLGTSRVDLLCGLEGELSTCQMNITVKPSGAWSEYTIVTSDASVASVDENGLIHAENPGKATITVTSTEPVKNRKSASLTVLVKQGVTSVTLSRTTLVTSYNMSVTLNATVLPENASNRRVTWTSSDKSVAKVSGSGKVTTVGYGSCVITCTAQDSGTVTAECEVIVPSYLTPAIYEGGGIRDDALLFSDDDLAALCSGLTALRDEYFDESNMDSCPQLVIYTCCDERASAISDATELAMSDFCDMLDTEYDYLNKTKKGMNGPIVIVLNVWQTKGRADVDIRYTNSTMKKKLGSDHIKEARSTLITGIRSNNSYVQGILDYADYLMSILSGGNTGN